MKRDMDLIRAILLRVEEEYGGISITNLSIEGNSLEEVAVHCKMLKGAGLVASCGINYADNGIYSFSVGGLTWDGAEYLDKIRDDSLWEKTKTIAREGASLSCSILLRRFPLSLSRLLRKGPSMLFCDLAACCKSDAQVAGS